MNLQELRQQIEDEAPYVDTRSHSHKIITICLGTIDKEYGTEEANKAIRDFKLERLGWSQVIPKRRWLRK